MAEAAINSMTLGLVEASWLKDIVGEIVGRTDLTFDNDKEACLANIEGSLYKPGNRHHGTKFH